MSRGVAVGVLVAVSLAVGVGVGVSDGIGEKVGVGTGVSVGVALVQPTPTIAARRSKVGIRIRITGLTPQFQKPIHIGAAINTGDRTHCQIDERFRTMFAVLFHTNVIDMALGLLTTLTQLHPSSGLGED